MASEPPDAEARRGSAGLAADHAWLRQLADAIPGFVLALGSDGLVRYVSGIPEPHDASRAIGLEFMTFVPETHHEAVAHAVQRALDGTTTRLQIDGLDLQGEPASYWTTFAPMGEGPPHAEVIVLSVDITQQRRMASELAESQERFQQLAEHITEVFWMTDPAKNAMLYISPGYERIWGRSCQDLYANPRAWLDAIHPDDRDRIMEAATTKQAAGTYDEEYRIVRTDGEQRWIRDRAFPVKNEQGEIYRITGVASDITDAKRREAELAQAESARARAEELEQVLFATSHTLRTPLRHIVSFLQLIEREAGDQLDDPLRSHIGHVYEGAGELTRLLDALGDYAQALTRGAYRDAIDTNRVLTFAEAHVRADMDARAPNVEADELPRVVGDAQQLELVFTHLLENAARFRGDEAPRVRVTARSVDDGVRLTFADNGRGITADQGDRVFRLFERQPGTDGQTGVGVGLTLCKRIVEAHGGRIWAEPRTDGTAFHLTLPAADHG